MHNHESVVNELFITKYEQLLQLIFVQNINHAWEMINYAWEMINWFTLEDSDLFTWTYFSAVLQLQYALNA